MEQVIQREGNSYNVVGSEQLDEEVIAELNNTKLIFKPEFIPFYLKEVKEYGFSNTEGLVYGFMRFYLANNPRKQFYFTNDQLAFMLDVSPRTISGAVGKVLECKEFQVEYKVKANGGTFRLVKICESDSKKPACLTSRKLLPKYNKVNNNKIKDTYKKEIVSSKKDNLDEIVAFYNEVFDKNTKSTKGFERNYKQWKDVHDLEKIKQAIVNARKDKFWRDKMTLTILFRTKNSNGEDVDYIEDISSREPSSKGSVAII